MTTPADSSPDPAPIKGVWRNRIVGLGEMAPDQLLANPHNHRIHPRFQQDALSGVLDDVGLVGAVIVNQRTGFVVDGHLRATLAIRTEQPTIPVLFVDLSEEEEAKILLTLDAIGALAGQDDEKVRDLLELVESSNAGVHALLAQIAEDAGATTLKGDVDADDVPEPPAEPITRTGDLILLGRHRLLCGDATSVTNVAALLDGVTPDLCLTDPPYCSGGFQESGRAAGSVGTDAVHKQIANDRLSTRGYQALLKQAISNTGAPFLYAFTDWRMWVWLFDIAESCGYGVRSMIAWDKGTPGMGRGWRSQHELILWACKDIPPFDKHASGQGNVIGEKRTGNVHHTTEKPIAVLKTLLDNTPFARVVADPFAGSGSTLIACEVTGAQCFAMELDPLYCDVIVQRWEAVTGQTAVRPERRVEEPPAGAES